MIIYFFYLLKKQIIYYSNSNMLPCEFALMFESLIFGILSIKFDYIDWLDLELLEPNYY